MSVPIFKLPTIKHKTTKDRKDFILDCLFVSVGISVLYVALNETFSDGTKELHKNRNRKEIAKIKSVFDRFKAKRDFVMEMIDKRDLSTIDYKIKSISRHFIESVSMYDKDMNLHYLAISILEQGLLRPRKTKLNEHLKMFCDFKLLYGEIMSNVEKASDYVLVDEWEVANAFVSGIKY